jgi:hypothetical protein
MLKPSAVCHREEKMAVRLDRPVVQSLQIAQVFDHNKVERPRGQGA